ncbi:MAG: capsule biosynthesis protein CapA [Proteobacteria bacterium]|nr:capsule biosynthesis protein CapA [Pseudomonadota bacterium]MBS0573527.1 capsule biosynthesis protein CapA [Pseudomonadota bacterium]
MSPFPPSERRFLFLQGPHGPFFSQLARMLGRTGARVWRVGFNRGDEHFWRLPGYVAHEAAPEDWPGHCARLIEGHRITDLVLYGDSRPIHAQAIRLARARGLTVHVFEEGYLRPYWVTYERDGSNGNSRLMEMTVEDMRRALVRPGAEMPLAPAHWGDMREHMFYGALYHFFVMALNGRYRAFRPHRGIAVGREFRLYLRRFLLMPWHRLERAIVSRRVRRGGFPYHLVLLQLEHDASFRAHSDLPSMAAFVDLCLDGFARGAPGHHHLVFKAHPLEDGRIPLRRLIARGAAGRGLAGRVHFMRGGKLSALLGAARAAVTVNSTAAQQALWRGLPVRIFGRAVYGKPQFVSSQPLPEFFAAPARPDIAAYRDFRHFLLETSQVPGGFYSARGRRQLLRQVVDMMLAARDPYDALALGEAAPRQQLHAVSG